MRDEAAAVIGRLLTCSKWISFIVTLSLCVLLLLSSCYWVHVEPLTLVIGAAVFEVDPGFIGRDGIYTIEEEIAPSLVGLIIAPSYDQRVLTLPGALLASPCILFTSALFWIDRRRPKPGYCKECRYDLRGNPSKRCSECGAVTASDEE